MRVSRENVRLDDAAERYLLRIDTEGQSSASLKNNREQLDHLRGSLGNPFVHNIDRGQMDQYCFGRGGLRTNRLTGEPLAGTSFNIYRSILNSFFRYAVLMAWTDINPMSAVPMAKPDAPKPKLRLSGGELEALLDHCQNPVERIACAIGMNTGLRANDLMHLTIFDVSLATGVIQTEIRKTRQVDSKPITLDLHNELILWLDTYARLMNLPDRGHLPDEWLLVPSYRNPAPNEVRREITLRPTKMYTKPHWLVQRPLRRMGYPTKGTGFHTLRRSAARAFFELLREKGDSRDHALKIVQAFLNHATAAMTERYLGLEAEKAIRDSLLKDRPFISRLRETEQERVSAGDPVKSIGDKSWRAS